MPRSFLTAACAAVLCALLPSVAAAQSAVSEPTGRPATSDGAAGRLLLGGEWLHRLDPAGTGEAEGLPEQGSTVGWERVRVPHAWNANDNSDASHTGSVGWYRRDFRVPKMEGKPEWIVRFLSVNHRMRAWLNGREIGAHSGPYLPFEMRLKGLRLKRVNRLVIRVGNKRKPVDFPPGRGLDGGWWNYGGILREVELRPVRGLDVEDVRALPELRCRRCAARVRVRAVVRGYSSEDQRVTVSGRLGGQRFELGRVRVKGRGRAVVGATVRVAKPELWSPDKPSLYRLIVDASSGRGSAQHRSSIGIRTVKVDDGRLELNFKPIRIQGVGVHEDEPGRGHALLPDQREELVRRAERIGAEMIRTHYPMHPHILEMADRRGMLVWSEVPVYRIKSLMDRPGVVDRAVDIARKNVELNANHPSIITWSLGNELRTTPTATEVDLFARGAAAVREVDTTRPVSLAIQTLRPYTCFAQAYAPIDLIGLNEYFGWYGGTNEELGPYLDAMRACHPDQAIMITEFGAEANRSGAPEEKGTYGFQARWTDAHLGIFASKPWLSGEAYWALNEFKVRPGWAGGNPLPDPPYHRKGLITYEDDKAKPAYVVVRDRFKALP